jgi:hypothetical protein
MWLMKKIKQMFNRAPTPDNEKERVLKKEAAQTQRVDALLDSYQKEKDFYLLQQARKPK